MLPATDPGSPHNHKHVEPDLSRIEVLLEKSREGGSLKLVSAGGEEIDLPPSIFPLLHKMVHALASGQTVSIVSVGQQLTTQQAADILNISRPHLVKLMEEGKLPFTRTGKHRRLLFEEVMAYKQQRDAERREGLAELTRLGEEMGDYA
ncbi:MAG: helix-turn-helix domain-containing protein [Chloroflexota bacterium]|nr:helix-turn-helix domain-containing protein [Chloroflexota bacterium]